jgi:hypothetical protein
LFVTVAGLLALFFLGCIVSAGWPQSPAPIAAPVIAQVPAITQAGREAQILRHQLNEWQALYTKVCLTPYGSRVPLELLEIAPDACNAVARAAYRTLTASSCKSMLPNGIMTGWQVFDA